MVEIRYVVAHYATPSEAEAARAALAHVDIAADLLPPSPRLAQRLVRMLRGRSDEVRLGVVPADVDRARECLGLPGCGDERR